MNHEDILKQEQLLLSKNQEALSEQAMNDFFGESDYFSEDEFRKCSPSCYKEDMDKRFLRRLNYLRAYLNRPLILTSAYRSSVHDRLKGRSGTGMHTKGRAVDIKCTDSYYRGALVHAALCMGFTVGISKDFVHLDDRGNGLMLFHYYK